MVNLTCIVDLPVRENMLENTLLQIHERPQGLLAWQYRSAADC